MSSMITESLGRPGAGEGYRDARFPVSFLPAFCYINSAIRARFRNQSAGIYIRELAVENQARSKSVR